MAVNKGGNWISLYTLPVAVQPATRCSTVPDLGGRPVSSLSVTTGQSSSRLPLLAMAWRARLALYSITSSGNGTWWPIRQPLPTTTAVGWSLIPPPPATYTVVGDSLCNRGWLASSAARSSWGRPRCKQKLCFFPAESWIRNISCYLSTKWNHSAVTIVKLGRLNWNVYTCNKRF